MSWDQDDLQQRDGRAFYVDASQMSQRINISGRHGGDVLLSMDLPTAERLAEQLYLAVRYARGEI